ncbi:MAG: hybrid sensor histidine kinase/response regulator [Bacteroidota bacterium]|nr:hybrid sensor histidine kinase/response regulator [Candidatus Kapabacteria bacterium]MDW8219652.1 hybrid sensor histidine kinase/response regulator [Bacteroidota bacterium]
MYNHRKKVVIIDDDEEALHTFEHILDSCGYYTFTASSGIEGISLVKYVQPDIVLCDVIMPDMNGYEVLSELRNHAATATIPVLLLSARGDLQEIRHAMKLGADDYLVKPFPTDDLLRCIEVRIAQREYVIHQSLQQLEQLRRSITMRLPHEFRTPLSSIIVFGELIVSEYDTLSREQIIDMVATIVSSGHRLNTLVENFIYLARLEILAQHEHAKEEFIASALVGAESIILETARHQISQHGNLHLLDDNLAPVTLKISDAYLRKIVAELVSNACKFSLPKTIIRLIGEIWKDFYVVSVSDEGHGMTPEQIAAVGAYMQFDREYHEQQGQGLGLEIVKRLVELHGGTLSITSVVEKGTTVRILLPREVL